MSTHRYARVPMEFAGMTISQGSLVMGAIASVNRDARRFSNPDELDVGRTENRHLTFGEGGPYCLGASLARMEGRIALSDILSRLPNLRVHGAESSLAWRHGLILRGLERIPVRPIRIRGRTRLRLVAGVRSTDPYNISGQYPASDRVPR